MQGAALQLMARSVNPTALPTVNTPLSAGPQEK